MVQPAEYACTICCCRHGPLGKAPAWTPSAAGKGVHACCSPAGQQQEAPAERGGGQHLLCQRVAYGHLRHHGSTHVAEGALSTSATAQAWALSDRRPGCVLSACSTPGTNQLPAWPSHVCMLQGGAAAGLKHTTGRPSARTLTSSAAALSIRPLTLSINRERFLSLNMVLYCRIMPGEAVAGGAGPSCCRTSLSCTVSSTTDWRVRGVCSATATCSSAQLLDQVQDAHTAHGELEEAQHGPVPASTAHQPLSCCRLLTTDDSTNTTSAAWPAWPIHCGRNTSHHWMGTAYPICAKAGSSRERCFGAHSRQHEPCRALLRTSVPCACCKHGTCLQQQQVCQDGVWQPQACDVGAKHPAVQPQLRRGEDKGVPIPCCAVSLRQRRHAELML